MQEKSIPVSFPTLLLGPSILTTEVAVYLEGWVKPNNRPYPLQSLWCYQIA